MRTRSGLINGARLHDHAAMSPSGRSITASLGKASFTLVAVRGPTLLLHETRARAKPKTGTYTNKTPLEATDAPQCAHRYLAAPADVDDDESGGETIAGTWTGTRKSGTTTELSVESIKAPNASTGRMCTRYRSRGSCWRRTPRLLRRGPTCLSKP